MGSLILQRYAAAQQKSLQNSDTNGVSMNRNLFTNINIKDTIKKQSDKGIKTINDYIIVCTIGQGIFGKVKKVFRKQNGIKKYYAIKIFSQTEMLKRKVFYKDQNGKNAIKTGFEFLIQEFEVYNKIHYHGLTKLYEILINDETDKAYLVMQLAQKGQLIGWSDTLQKWQFKDPKRKILLNEDQLRRLMRDLSKSIYVLHKNNIIHRDIKPQNILFDSKSNVKLSDFGISLLGSDIKISKITGTLFFLAPQSFYQDKNRIISGKPLDIWALGVTMYSFKYLQVPFYGKNSQQTQQAIKNKKLQYESISPQLKHLFKRMLQKDPQKRITIEQIIKDKWMNQECDSLTKQLQNEQIKINQNYQKLLTSKAIVGRKNLQMSSSSSEDDNENQDNSSISGSVVSSKKSQASTISQLEKSRKKVIVQQPNSRLYNNKHSNK